MQVTSTEEDGLKREVTIVVSSDDIEKHVVERLEKLGQEIRLPGFRPGKVPMSVLRQRYGKSVLGEVLQQTVDTNAQEALTENEWRPAMQPNIEVTKFDEGEDLKFKMKLELMPEFEPSDFSGIKLEKMVAEVDDSSIEEALGKFADQQKTFVAAKDGAKAENGNAVVIDFLGKRDGVPFDGGKGEAHQLELGSGQFIPGFEEQLVGTKAGDHVDVSLTFPEDYQAADLAGAAVIFEVDVKEVKVSERPPIDDDLAKGLGLENLDDLKSKVREQISGEYASISRERLKRKLLDQLDEMHDFDLPPGLVEVEFEAIWKRVEEDKEKGNEDEDAKGKDEDQLKEEYRAIAERRVRLGILLQKVGEANEIKVTQEEVNRAISAQAQRYPGQEREIFEHFQNDPQASAQLQAPMFEEKVVDFIIELAKVTDRTVPLDELTADPDADQAPGEKALARLKSAKKSSAKKKADAKPAAKKAASADKKAAVKKPAAKKKAAPKKSK
jgi:trigger factor